MSRRWFVAKFIQDPLRRETRNVGVVLVGAENRVLMKFRGEDAPGMFNGRRTRFAGSASSVYRSWVKYWRRSFDRARTDEEIARVLAKSTASGIYLEESGEELVGDRSSDEAFLDQLYGTLVSVREEDREESGVIRRPTLEQVMAAIFTDLNVSNDVHRGVYAADDEQVFFDYWLDGDYPTVMSRVAPASNAPEAWMSAQAAAYAFDTVKRLRRAKCVALLEPDADGPALPLVTMHANAVVHLSDPAEATKQIGEILREEAAE